MQIKKSQLTSSPMAISIQTERHNEYLNDPQHLAVVAITDTATEERIPAIEINDKKTGRIRSQYIARMSCKLKNAPREENKTVTETSNQVVKRRLRAAILSLHKSQNNLTLLKRSRTSLLLQFSQQQRKLMGQQISLFLRLCLI